MMACAVVGHSYVARLEEARYLCLAGVDFYCDCRRGATTRSVLDSGLLEDVTESGPERIFLQLGGNDIREKTKPSHILKGIEKIVNYLRDAPSVKCIVVGCLFRRFRPLDVTYAYYEEVKCNVNHLLKLRYAMDPVVNVWNFRGLINLDYTAFSDGVHLNPEMESVYAASVSRSLRCVNFRS